jgi:hypothetical protein
MRRRYAQGARAVWRVVHGPPGEAEDPRPRPRDLATLKQERARTTTRLTGFLRSQGRRLTSLHTFAAPLEAWRRWEGSPMPRGWRRRGLRVSVPHAWLRPQMAALAAARRALLHRAQDASLAKGRQFMHRKGLGSTGAWWWGMACVGGWAWQHRRAVGG